MIRKLTFLVLLLSGVSFTQVAAQNGPQTVRNEDLNIQFIVPADWTVNTKNGGYLLAPADTEGFIMINVQEVKSQTALREAMENGIVQDDGTKMMPVAELNDLGKQGVAGLYKGKLGENEMEGFMMALMPPTGERAVVAVVVAPVPYFNQSHMDILKSVVRSVVFL